MHKDPEPEPLPTSALTRRKGEGEEAFATRSADEVRRLLERRAKIAHYARELGPQRAVELVDKLP